MTNMRHTILELLKYKCLKYDNNMLDILRYTYYNINTAYRNLRFDGLAFKINKKARRYFVRHKETNIFDKGRQNFNKGERSKKTHEPQYQPY